MTDITLCFLEYLLVSVGYFTVTNLKLLVMCKLMQYIKPFLYDGEIYCSVV